MEMVVLIIHLLVSICLIGLVLLQRSEGGALGMGGGSGSLMSGRGAADALAKMTSVAGGFFLVTSLGLTVLAGAASTGDSSVFDLLPRTEQTAPAPAPAAPAPAAPEQTRPDPTESSIPAETQLASATVPAPAPANAATRAMPLGPSSAAAATPPPAQRTTAPAPRNTGGTVTPASATTNRPPATNRSSSGTTPANTASSEPPLVLPNTSGGVSGITLTDDPAAQTESIQIGNGVEAVRRDQRAGPEQ